MNRREFIGCISSIAAVPLVGCEPGSPGRQIRTQFGWIFDAHHAGFVTALRLGHYSNVGLAPSLLPGGTDTNPVRMVVSSAAEIGQAGGIEQLITAADEGLPVQPIAAIHRKSPHALISTERNPIRTPADLRGKRIAVAFGDTAEILLKAFLQRNGIPLDELELVPFRFDITPLLRGHVQAVTGFRTDQPATIISHGQRPVTLAYDDFGLRSYGYTLFTTARNYENERDVLNRFLLASREGWEVAFEDPRRAIRMLSDFSGGPIDETVEIQKLQLIREIMIDEAGRLANWSIDSNVLTEVVGFLTTAGQMRRNTDPREIIARFAG